MPAISLFSKLWLSIESVRLNPAVIEFIRTSLLLCSGNHEDLCEGSSRLKLINHEAEKEFLLIDVTRYCLIQGSFSMKYFALSYVWGGIPQLKTTRANLERFQSDGTLFKHGGIPNVVKDAMSLVSSLGERYLWVDALCVVQDSPKMNLQLMNMAAIYHNAFATIISLNGRHANYPLARLREGPLRSNTPRLRPSQMQSLEEASNLSTYNTRGWTLQERLLSRRCILFTSQQVFFHCRETVRGERDDQMGTYPHFTGFNIFEVNRIFLRQTWLGMNGYKPDRLFQYYARLVTEFTQRQFSEDDDVWKAFYGIKLGLQCHLRWNFCSALVGNFLASALLWTPMILTHTTRLKDLRRNSIIDHDGNTIPAPSWCWIGWKAAVEYNTLRAFTRANDYRFQSGEFYVASGRLTLHTRSFPITSFQFRDIPPLFDNDVGIRQLPNQKFVTEILDDAGTICGVLYGIRADWLESLQKDSLKLVRLPTPQHIEKRRWTTLPVLLVELKYSSRPRCCERIGIGRIDEYYFSQLGSSIETLWVE